MARYIALLRGVNVSGKNKILMSDLKEVLKEIGFINIITYLNSGNVIFTSDISDKTIIANNIHQVIFNTFNLDISIYVITLEKLKEILDNHPIWWGKNLKETYDNIIFLLHPIKFEEVYRNLGKPKDEYEKIYEYKNAIFWTFERNNYTKTNWWARTANASIKNSITIRTANTIRKIIEICNNN